MSLSRTVLFVLLFALYFGGNTTLLINQETEEAACSQVECFSASGNCDGKAEFDGIVSNAKFDERAFQFNDFFRQQCDKTKTESSISCGDLAEGDKSLMMNGIGGLTDDTYFQELYRGDIENKRKPANRKWERQIRDGDDPYMVGEYCSGACWWGFESQPDCVVIFRRTHQGSMVSFLFSIFGLLVFSMAGIVLSAPPKGAWVLVG